jgi:exodeoxyribonuclease VII large subunit
LGYRETLSRGFAVVRGTQGLVTGAEAAAAASSLEIEFHDGRVTVVPQSGGAPVPPTPQAAPAPKAATKPAAKAKPKPPVAPGDQGSLF